MYLFIFSKNNFTFMNIKTTTTTIKRKKKEEEAQSNK